MTFVHTLTLHLFEVQVPELLPRAGQKLELSKTYNLASNAEVEILDLTFQNFCLGQGKSWN